MNEACSRGDGPHLCPCNIHKLKVSKCAYIRCFKTITVVIPFTRTKSTHVLQKQGAKHVKTPNSQQKNL